MLAIPNHGVSRSIGAHNSDLNICCDWIEASVLFRQEDVTDAEIVDLLLDNQYYDKQDFAWEFVNDIALNLKERARLLGRGYPVNVGAHRFSPNGTMDDFPAYSFCLALSLSVPYPGWAKAFGADFTSQGELFERLTAQSVSNSFGGWTVHSTGWTRTQTNKLKTVVKTIAALLGESAGDILRWSKASANEAGLDLLCFRPFPDGRVGVPIYLMQCASGKNWEKKLHTPNLNTWRKLITFAADPKKAFSMPFALMESDFTIHTAVVDGLLLDRHRLLAPGITTPNWISADLEVDIRNWIGARVPTLPLLDTSPA